MAAERIVDASVAAKVWFEEAQSQAAREALSEAGSLIAPDLLLIEIASVAAKRVRRGLSTPDRGAQAVRDVGALFDHIAASAPLTPRAFDLARRHGISAYDGIYLALAEARGARLITADHKLIAMARAAGLGELVEALAGG